MKAQEKRNEMQDPAPEAAPTPDDSGVEFQTMEIGRSEEDRLRDGIREEISPADRSLVKNADPRYRYRGATHHVNRPGRVDYWKALGYEVVPWDAKESWAFGGRRDKEKGAQFRGDQILLRTPMQNFETRRKRARDKERRRMGEVHEQAKENINRIARDGTGGRGRLAGPHENVATGELPRDDAA